MQDNIDALTGVSAFQSILASIAALEAGGVDYRVGLVDDWRQNWLDDPSYGSAAWLDSQVLSDAEIAAQFSAASANIVGSGSTPTGCEHVLTNVTTVLELDSTGFLRSDAVLLLVLVSDVDDYLINDNANQHGPPYASIAPGALAPCAELPTLPQDNLDQLVALKNNDIDGLSTIVIAGPPDSANGYATLDWIGAPGACNCVPTPPLNLVECEAYDALKMWDFVDLANATNPGSSDRAYTADICGNATDLPDKVNAILTNTGVGGYCGSISD
jgi:hypothetical protein